MRKHLNAMALHCKSYDDWLIFVFETILQTHTLSEKKVQKSCHWGCAFSNGKLLSILGAYK